MTPRALRAYSQICGWTLARAAVASYLGRGSRFDEAVAASPRPTQTRHDSDFAALEAAASAGKIRATARP